MTPSPSAKRVALLLLLAGGIGGGAYWWWHDRPPEPPAVDLADADPEVARAVEKARADVASSPRSGSAWGQLGMVLAVHSFDSAARTCFAEAERRDPNDPRWPYLHGLMLRTESPEDALPLLERAAGLAGQNTVPRLVLAETLVEHGQLDEAEAHFRRVPEADLQRARACLGLARIALLRDDASAAVDLLREAADITPDAPPIRALLAEAYQRAGDAAAARSVLQQSFREDFEWPDPYVEQMSELRVGIKARLASARRLVSQRNPAGALDVLHRATSDYPDTFDAWLALGQVLLQTKDQRAAAEALRTAVRLRPDSFDARFYLASAQSDYRAAAEEYRRALALNPRHALAHYNLAICLKASGDQEKAIEELREALRYKPDLENARYELAALLTALGRDAEALQQLEFIEQVGTLDEKGKELKKRLRGRESAGQKP